MIISLIGQGGLERFLKDALVEYCKERRHDLVLNSLNADIIFDVKFQAINYLKRKKIGAKKVLIFPDVVWRYEKTFTEEEPCYDYIFFTSFDERIDNKRYFYFGVGYDPSTHYPYLVVRKTIDVCFVGTKHKDRDWIRKIPNITIYGNEWGNGIYAIYDAKKRHIYGKTKIMINHHVAGSTENMRDYESLAMKTFLLSDVVLEHLEGGMVHYSDQADLERKIAYYLEHEVEREKIAAKGYEVVQQYTYKKRIEDCLEKINESSI